MFSVSAGADNSKQRREWEAEYIKPDMDQAALCELASAAYYLDIKNLVNLTSKMIATQISSKTGDELKDSYIMRAATQSLKSSSAAVGDTPAIADSPINATRARLHKKLESKRKPSAAPNNQQSGDGAGAAVTRGAAVAAAAVSGGGGGGERENYLLQVTALQLYHNHSNQVIQPRRARRPSKKSGPVHAQLMVLFCWAD